ncbi:hypothetical protein DL93DRAFT_576531 [Clavulina sp. PMI_390]|nr:hypothetical protein DL93DRAFT_576531 [Clavulina sp. PMI_390]
MLDRPFHALAVLFTVIASTVALPRTSLEERDTSPKCVTYKSGYLATSVINGLLGAWTPFTFHSGTIAYAGGSGTPISVQFQTCTPNYAGSSNVYQAPGDQLYGRLYLPDTKSCIAVDTTTGYGKSTSCLSSASGDMATAASIPQNFAWRTFSQDDTHQTLFWAGAATANGTQGAGGTCGGFYGYQHPSGSLVPTQGPNQVTTYMCNSNSTLAGVFADLRPTATGTSS